MAENINALISQLEQSLEKFHSCDETMEICQYFVNPTELVTRFHDHKSDISIAFSDKGDFFMLDKYTLYDYYIDSIDYQTNVKIKELIHKVKIATLATYINPKLHNFFDIYRLDEPMYKIEKIEQNNDDDDVCYMDLHYSKTEPKTKYKIIEEYIVTSPGFAHTMKLSKKLYTCNTGQSIYLYFDTPFNFDVIKPTYKWTLSMDDEVIFGSCADVEKNGNPKNNLLDELFEFVATIYMTRQIKPIINNRNMRNK